MNKIILLLSICLTLSPGLVFAYDDDTTHPGITEQIVEFYNLNNNSQISLADKELIIQGSIDEDNPSLQSLNHFYDPTRDIGMNDYRTALSWATLPNNGNSFTWAENIEKYAKGDRDGALIGLGHILHLIEDMTVPDHTRNDAHIADGLSGAYTGVSVYEKWAKEHKTRETLGGVALYYKSLGWVPKKIGSLKDYFTNIASYSNNNYVSPDTIENDIYQYANPIVKEVDDKYVYGIDSYYYDNHLLYCVTQLENGKTIKGLVGFNQDDNSVLEEYFSRLSKMAILSGAGIVELFLNEAEYARTEYSKDEAEKLKEIADYETEKGKKITEGSFLSKIWNRLSYGVRDTTSAITGSLSNVGKYFVSIFYNGGSLAYNVTTNTTDSLGFTATELASIGSQKVEQGVQKAKKVIVSAGQKVILYVKEKSITIPGLMGPAVVYNPPAEIPQPPIDPSIISDLLAILAIPADANESDANNIAIPVHIHRSSGGHNDSEPERTEEVSTTTATTTEVIFDPVTSTSTSTASTTDPIIDPVSTTTATTTDILDPLATTTATSTEPIATTTEGVVEPNIFVPEPPQCADSLTSEACLIMSTELSMSWSSTIENFDHFTIIINGEAFDTADTSDTLDLYDYAENVIEIYAVDSTGLESDHIIYEVSVYSQPISIDEVFFDEETDTEGQKIILYNETPYDLDLANWSLVTKDNLFSFDLAGQISGEGEFVLIKDSGDFSAETNNQTFTDSFTRDSRFLYLTYSSDRISQYFLGILSAW